MSGLILLLCQTLQINQIKEPTAFGGRQSCQCHQQAFNTFGIVSKFLWPLMLRLWVLFARCFHVCAPSYPNAIPASCSLECRVFDASRSSIGYGRCIRWYHLLPRREACLFKLSAVELVGAGVAGRDGRPSGAISLLTSLNFASLVLALAWCVLNCSSNTPVTWQCGAGTARKYPYL